MKLNGTTADDVVMRVLASVPTRASFTGMWLVIGTKEKTERVPNGRRVERHCSQCGEVAMFYERRAISTFQVYFLDLVDYASRAVMVCGACGTLYATDDVGPRAPSTFDAITGAAEQVGTAIASGANRTIERISSAARGALRSEAAEPRPAEPRATDDPLADEDAALEARFKELERRGARVRIGDD